MTKTSLRAPLKRLKASSVLNFEFWSFEFVSNFDIRISDFDASLVGAGNDCNFSSFLV